MKTKILYRSLIFAVLVTTTGFEGYSQRRVVVTQPSRTVVVTRVPRSRVVYVNPRPVPPPRPVVIRTMPPTAVVVVHGRYRYHYCDGFYYAARPEGYVIVRPPAGIVITVLPVNSIRITVAAGGVFFYNGGIFYRESEGGYKTVTPPAGARVPGLPENAEKVNVEGKIFYEDNGTLYQKVETETGFAYEVSGNVED